MKTGAVLMNVDCTGFFFTFISIDRSDIVNNFKMVSHYPLSITYTIIEGDDFKLGIPLYW